jgi:hypothetical protein
MKAAIRALVPALVLLCGPALAGSDPVKSFQKAAKSNNRPAMIAAAQHIGDAPSKKGVKALVKFGALIESIDVYLACRDALSNCKSGDARDELLKSLIGAKRMEQRVLCADALGRSPGAASVEALGKALNDKEKPVRIAVVRALKAIERGDCVPHLFKRLGKLGFKNADAEAEELYGSLYALTGKAYEDLGDWEKWWQTVGSDFDPKTRAKGGDEQTTRKRQGEGKIFDSVVRSQAFVLVLDISSSMRVIDLPAGESWKDKKGKPHKYKDPDPSGRKKPHPDSRFERARSAFIKFLEGMSERAKFSIIVFGEQKDTKPWQPKPVQANKGNKKKAIAYVKKLRWSYATRTDLAIEEAFKIQGVDSIYLYSDGIPEKRKSGKTSEIPTDEILEKARTLNRARKLKINCYGMASSKAMRGFLRKLAEENDGEYKDIRVLN